MKQSKRETDAATGWRRHGRGRNHRVSSALATKRAKNIIKSRLGALEPISRGQLQVIPLTALLIQIRFELFLPDKRPLLQALLLRHWRQVGALNRGATEPQNRSWRANQRETTNTLKDIFIFIETTRDAPVDNQDTAASTRKSVRHVVTLLSINRAI